MTQQHHYEPWPEIIPIAEGEEGRWPSIAPGQEGPYTLLDVNYSREQEGQILLHIDYDRWGRCFVQEQLIPEDIQTLKKIPLPQRMHISYDLDESGLFYHMMHQCDGLLVEESK